MVLLCQIFLTNTDRLLNSAIHKRQNYDQIRTVVSIDLGISLFIDIELIVRRVLYLSFSIEIVLRKLCFL